VPGQPLPPLFKDTAFYDSLETLSKKIKTTLPPQSLNYVKNLDHTLQIRIEPYKDYAKFKEINSSAKDSSIKPYLRPIGIFLAHEFNNIACFHEVTLDIYNKCRTSMNFFL
jgi:hypothetical protein